MCNKRGQISTEYLILISFITFFVIAILGIAFVYTNQIKDTIRSDQIEKFSNKIITSAESIFFAGEPSKIKITVYVPEGVKNIKIENKDIIFNFTTSSGENIRAFSSKVDLQGTITPTSGVKVLTLTAQNDKVIIS